MRTIAALLVAFPLLAAGQSPPPARPAAPANAEWEQVPPAQPASPAAPPAPAPPPPAAQASPPAAAPQAAPPAAPPPQPPPAYPPPPQAAPPAPPPQQAPPSEYVPPPAHRAKTRDGWYIGFGIGGGDGLVANATQTIDFREANGDRSTTAVFVNFKVGGTLTPKLLLGGDISGISAASDSGGVKSSVTISNVDAVMTYFPWERGVFVRGGVGLSGITYTFDGPAESKDASSSGFNLMGGVGYALWLGRQFNLTANLDLSRQWFSKSDVPWEDSQFWSLWLGFDWY